MRPDSIAGPRCDDVLTRRPDNGHSRVRHRAGRRYGRVLDVPMLQESELIGAFVFIAPRSSPLHREADRTSQELPRSRRQSPSRSVAGCSMNCATNSQVKHDGKNSVNFDQQLEQRITDQVGEIKHMGRLRRLPAPQVADDECLLVKAAEAAGRYRAVLRPTVSPASPKAPTPKM